MNQTAIYQPKVRRAERKLSIRGVNYCLHEWGSADAPLFVYLHGWGGHWLDLSVRGRRAELPGGG